MLKLDSCSVRCGDSNVLKKIRLSVYVVQLCHLTVLSVYLLRNDYSKSKDPHLQVYVTLKWKLLTVWFNLLLGPYLLVSILYEWYNLRQEESRYVSLMNKIKNFYFTSIVAPITMFADILFWSLYTKDKTMVLPISADEFISIWNHHSMHTISLLFVIFDLVCVPRKRPKNMTAGIIALLAFIILYSSMCFHSMLNGEYIYPVFRTFSITKFFICFVYMCLASLSCYTAQWIIVDMVWKSTKTKKKVQ